ncbi:hypothetical protein AD929_07205 [Gluconobacter potus]|uniref:Uncharacterized protein n=1 Tax=Gluconobacter potus TaxID=2724927 RepID=A0A149QVD2_9PROT|nr:hypothetical protein [Gluconobacter potus]KXV01265.1 hypothetical protein AD929_07205 [Gluconobacter potus]
MMGLFPWSSGPKKAPETRAFQELGGRPRPLVRLGSVRQALLAPSMAMVPIGNVHAETWWKSGLSWQAVHEAGWRTATDRIREQARALGADAVLNLRYRLEHHGGALGFMLHGEVVRVPQLGRRGVIPCVPWNAATLDVALAAGIVPVSYGVGTWEEVRYTGPLEGFFDAMTLGESALLTQAKRAARDAAALSLRNDPVCQDWDGALGHDETVGLMVRSERGVVKSIRVRAAVSILGYRRIVGQGSVLPAMLCGLEETVRTGMQHRPLFAGVSNRIEVEEEVGEGRVEAAVLGLEAGGEVVSEVAEGLGGLFDGLGDLF